MCKRAFLNFRNEALIVLLFSVKSIFRDSDILKRGCRGRFSLQEEPTRGNSVNTKIMQRLKKIDQLINRYERQKTLILSRKGQTIMDLRKARTRTLIQLGGLVEKSGLLEPLNLSVGNDLQKDIHCLESAAILMGALSDICATLHGEDAHGYKILWAEKGKEALAR